MAKVTSAQTSAILIITKIKQTRMIKSPCIGVCSTTSLAADYFCRGCGRSVDEIRDWGSFTEIRKASIVIVCEYRVANYEECESIRRETDVRRANTIR